MPKYYDDWAILTRLQKDVEIVTKEVSEAIVKEWRALVDLLFYQAYDPKVYERTNESIDSISILDIKSDGDKFEVKIGYDVSKINTYDRGWYKAHEKPSYIPSMIEYGAHGGIIGHDPDGVRSLDELKDMIKNGHFNDVVEKKLKKMGYEVTFK